MRTHVAVVGLRALRRSVSVVDITSLAVGSLVRLFVLDAEGVLAGAGPTAEGMRLYCTQWHLLTWLRTERFLLVAVVVYLLACC